MPVTISSMTAPLSLGVIPRGMTQWEASFSLKCTIAYLTHIQDPFADRTSRVGYVQTVVCVIPNGTDVAFTPRCFQAFGSTGNRSRCVSHPFLGTSMLGSASASVVYLRWIGTVGSFLPTARASVLPTAPRHLDERYLAPIWLQWHSQPYLAPIAFAALAPASCVQTQHCSQEDDIDTSVAEKLDRFLLGLTAASHPTYTHDSLYTPSSSFRPRRRNRIVDTHIVPYLQYCTRSL